MHQRLLPLSADASNRGYRISVPDSPKLDMIFLPTCHMTILRLKSYRSLKLVEPQTQSSDETGPLTANSEQNI
jgi:hypothetical protein